MFSLFSNRPKRETVPEQIYGMLVAHARNPAFFSDFGIPDTVMGRFDMLALHVYLFSRRMKKDGSERALSLSQEVFDLFVADVERALREIGIGDTTVPKRKKKMVRSFYGQIEDFDKAIDEKDDELLENKVSERFYEGKQAKFARNLANHMQKIAGKLEKTPSENFMAANIDWPEPQP